MLQDKVAFVTGSTRGIGLAVAEIFLEHGATVILNGHSSEDLLQERVASLNERFPGKCSGLSGDIGQSQVVRDIYRQIYNQHKRLDILVNNAGVLHDALLGMIPDQLIDDTLSVNVRGALLNLQAAARLMGRNKSGAIVNVSSIIGLRGHVGQVVYAASKAAVVGMTLSASKELAPANIRVNAVAPGYIDTDMTRQLPPAKQADLLGRIGLGRPGTPRDVAQAILFLVSPQAAYITGQVLAVDGGIAL